MGSTDIAVQLRNIVVVSIKTCYRSVCSHPFIVGMLCFLLFLYRSFPFVFSLLVSASPVLLCTALLLGTLLSFGQPSMVPEVEKDDDKVSHSPDVATLKAGISGHNTVVVDDQRDESFVVERYTGKGSEIVEEAIEGASSADERVGNVDVDDGLVDYVPLIDHSSREIQLERRVFEEVEGEFHDLELDKKREVPEENFRTEDVSNEGEALENQYFVVHQIRDEVLEVLSNVKHLEESVDAHRGNHLHFSSKDDEDGDDGSSDLGSDLAESSSPDASMADILPMLDELHPLLDLEAPQPVHISHDESDVAMERSHKSNRRSIESDAESDIHGEVEEDGADENEDDEEEEEEEAQGGKEDESKSAIKWTEDDQKNLMDLGTSELERNQRLYNLIARRRARKNMRLMAEKNLIDLDATDLPFNVPPISTARRNPFDLPYDSYDPPGSAPSILLPRRNPFDLPYDPNEEKPDLKGDSFQQEFTTFQQKDTFFRRHESFSMGPSGPRQDRNDIRLRPFFVPERFTSEGTSYSSYERQSSGVSESKLSSVPDTESASSHGDQDDKKLNEQDFCEETELISIIDHDSNLIEHGSQFSAEIDSVEIDPVGERDVQHDEVEITLGQVGNYSDLDSSLSETPRVTVPLEFNTTDSPFKTQPVEEEYSRMSSLSSVLEIEEKISDAQENELMNLEPRGNIILESGITSLASLEEINFQVLGGEVGENQHEPVYDSSPPASGKISSFPSISSDLQAEISVVGPPPVSVETIVPILDKEYKLHGESLGEDSATNTEMHGASSVADPEHEREPRSREVLESGKDGFMHITSSGVNLGDQNVIEHVSVKSRSSPDIGSAEDGITYKEESMAHKQDQDGSLSVDSEFVFGVHQDVSEKFDSVVSSYQMASENVSLSRKEEQHPQPLIVVEQVSVISSENEPIERHVISKEKTLQPEQDQVYPSCSSESLEESLMYTDRVLQPKTDQVQSSSFDDADTHVGGHQYGGENSDLVALSPQHIPLLDEQQPPLVSEQVMLVLPDHSTSETAHAEAHWLNKPEIIQFQKDNATAIGSDAEIGADLHQDLNVKVVSLGYSGEHVPSEKEAQSDSEKHLPDVDKSMVEAIYRDHDESPESYRMLTESTEIGRITSNGDELELLDATYKILPKVPSLASDSTQTDVPGESPVCKTATSELDLNADVVGVNVNEDHVKVSEDLSCLAEAYDSLAANRNIKEEEDEIKEIDEGLLSELDAVGDFSVKDLGDPQGINFGSTEFELLSKELNPPKTEMDLPVREAISLEDINLALKQPRGVDVEEVLPSMVDDWLVVGESEDHVESSSNLIAVDAKSLEDIHAALQQVSEVNLHDVPVALDSKDHVESSSNLIAVDAKSLEDIHAALQQVSEVNLHDVPVALDSKDHGESCSNLIAVDAKSLEHIHAALPQVSEVNLNDVPVALDSKDPDGSTKEIESSDVGSGVQETSKVATDEPEPGSDETPGNITLSITETFSRESKEAKPHPANSSSSSSSSSSESD
ncbi:hypothetical protein CJ030_MR2G013659 [Morella rubra]|uniref:Uncharacterized protein n=1 Tax=Morella rubra TaxID=262757 RepID=A0A6A1WJQ4_9ROSI|nr:hypothetical protein CJ030_MR2G013659 [Morella rubra]